MADYKRHCPPTQLFPKIGYVSSVRKFIILTKTDQVFFHVMGTCTLMSKSDYSKGFACSYKSMLIDVVFPRLLNFKRDCYFKLKQYSFPKTRRIARINYIRGFVFQFGFFC